MKMGYRVSSGGLDFYTAIPQPLGVQATARIWICFLAALTVVGCKTLDQADDAESEASPQPAGMKIPVGQIHMVDPQGRFVLVRSSRTFQVESGTRMTSYADDGSVTGIFEVSSARKGAFLSADILQGTPMKGEQVLMDYSRSEIQNPTEVPFGGMDTDVQVLE